MINCSFALIETYKYNSIVQQEIDSTPKLHFPMKKKQVYTCVNTQLEFTFLSNKTP